MGYWIDTDSSSDNVIVATDSSLFIGSVDEENHVRADEHLKSGKSPEEVLGSFSPKIIPYIQLLSVVSRNTDKNVDVKFKAKDGPQTETLYFDSIEKKNSFVETVGPLIPQSLNKSEFQQNRFSAAMWPMYSLALCAFVAFFYINKFRMPVMIICGIWAAVSLWSMFGRLKTPPVITRWNIKGRHASKAWHGMKAGLSFAFLLAIVAGVSEQIPDSWGKKAIAERMYNDMLGADEVEKLVGRGADINYTDDDMGPPLFDAIRWEEEDLALALIESGADLNGEYDEMNAIEMAIDYGASNDLIEAMLKKGASLDFTFYDDSTPIEYAQELENFELVTIFENHLPVKHSSLD